MAQLVRVGRMLTAGRLSAFDPTNYEIAFDVSDLDTLKEERTGASATTAASVNGPVGSILNKGTLGGWATAPTDAARPTLRTGNKLEVDKVDDRLQFTVPTGGITGTMVLATPEGTAAYGVNFPAGSQDMASVSGIYFPGTGLVGRIIKSGAMSEAEKAAAIAYMRDQGGGLSYAGVTVFTNYWRGQYITDFPVIDTSNGTNFYAAWDGCTRLTSFPLLDVTSGVTFGYAWRSCQFASFPLLDFSSGLTFNNAWDNCTKLVEFPAVEFSSATTFLSAWQGCTSLTTFPPNVFDTTPATTFTNAFFNTNLTQASIDNILVSINTAGTSSGTFTQTGGSAPSATGNAAIDAMRARGWTVTVTGGY